MSYKAIISVTVDIEIDDDQDHPDDWDYLDLFNANYEGNEVLSLQVNADTPTFIHDCPNCGGHESPA
jgi:hypothetical protein